MNRIIFGGGFDPVHLGHLNMALNAQKMFPGEVIFVPAKVAVWKESSVSEEHKLAMLKLAIKDYPDFKVDTFELDQEEQPRSYLTVAYFKKKYPYDKLYFLIGQDQVNAFHEWAHPEEIAAKTQIIYFKRPKYEINQANVDKYHMLAVNGPEIEVSSSDVRELKAAFMPEDVLSYIEDNDLYYVAKIKSMISEKRFNHSKLVAHLAYKLAKMHQLDYSKAYIAGIIHDIAKYYEPEEALAMMKQYYPDYLDIGAYAYHQFLGEVVAKEKFNIIDIDILNAIKYHTTGHGKMSQLEKIIYAADKIEPSRPYDSSDLIQAMEEDINSGFLTVLERNMEFLKARNKNIDNRLTEECVKYYLG